MKAVAIPLQGGKLWAVISPEDYEKVIPHQWRIDSKGKYAFTRIRENGQRIHLRMHRYILGITDSSIFVDHKDGDPLNNHRSNLRICTNSQNQANRGVPTSFKHPRKFKGVYWRPKKKAYVAEITCRGIRHYLGLFRSDLEAARAYNEKALQLFGEFALLNPIEQELGRVGT